MKKKKLSNIFVRENAHLDLFNLHIDDCHCLDIKNECSTCEIKLEDQDHNILLLFSENTVGRIPYFLIRKYTGDIIRVRLDRAEYYRLSGEIPTPYNTLNKKEEKVLAEYFTQSNGISHYFMYRTFCISWNYQNPNVKIDCNAIPPDYRAIKEPIDQDTSFENERSALTLLASFSPNRKKKIDHLILPEEQTDDILNVYWNARGDIPYFIIQRSNGTNIQIRLGLPKYLGNDTLTKKEARVLNKVLNFKIDGPIPGRPLSVYEILVNCWNALNQNRMCSHMPDYKQLVY